MSFCLLQVTYLLEGNCQIVVGVGKPRLLRQGLLHQGNGFLQDSLLLSADPQKVQRFRVGGPGLQHLLVEGDGLFQLPPLVMVDSLNQQGLQVLFLVLSAGAQAFSWQRHLAVGEVEEARQGGGNWQQGHHHQKEG